MLHIYILHDRVRRKTSGAGKEKMYKNVLITGGCGFLGRHFTHFLAEHGAKVVNIDDLSVGVPYNKWPNFLKTDNVKKNTTFVHEDALYFFKAEDNFSKQPFDLAIHLAAIVKGRENIEKKPELAVASMTLDNEFFRWCARNKPGKAIFMSSSAAYPVGLQNEYPILDWVAGQKTFIPEALEEVDFTLKNDPEFTRIGMPDKLYGWSKVSGEVIAKEFAETYDLNVLCPRPFSGYGEDQSLSYPFPSIIKRIIDGENPIEVWGTGQQVRDFIHVDDLIQSIFNYLPHSSGYDTINLGSGQPTSFLELINTAQKVLNTNYAVKPLTEKPTGVKTRYCNNTKMLSYYKPTINLELGIKRVANYLKEQDEHNNN